MDAIGLSLAALTCVLLVRQRLQVKRYREKQRIFAEEAFQKFSVASTDERFFFDGNKAQVMDDKEVVEEAKGVILIYSLTRVARNENGEYFWFRFRTDSSPLFKHLDHATARVLLKDKYASPPCNG